MPRHYCIIGSRLNYSVKITGGGDGGQKQNLPGPSTRDTETVKYIESYVKEEDQEENHVAKGAVVPENTKAESKGLRLTKTCLKYRTNS